MIPPGKYSSPVIAVSTSAAARENVECPDTYPANGGVTKLGRWYGHQLLASIQSTHAVSIDGSLIYLGHFHDLILILPIFCHLDPASVSPVPMSSIYPGISGNPITS